MNFIKNNIWTLCLTALFCFFGFAGEAAASGGGATIMGTAEEKAKNVFGAIKTIVFIVGGFGLVGVAWAAIWGKMQWKWVGALAVGLALVAAASSIIDYATGSRTDLGDTFQDVSGY